MKNIKPFSKFNEKRNFIKNFLKYMGSPWEKHPFSNDAPNNVNKPPVESEDSSVNVTSKNLSKEEKIEKINIIIDSLYDLFDKYEITQCDDVEEDVDKIRVNTFKVLDFIIYVKLPTEPFTIDPDPNGKSHLFIKDVKGIQDTIEYRIDGKITVTKSRSKSGLYKTHRPDIINGEIIEISLKY